MTDAFIYHCGDVVGYDLQLSRLYCERCGKVGSPEAFGVTRERKDLPEMKHKTPGVAAKQKGTGNATVLGAALLVVMAVTLGPSTAAAQPITLYRLTLYPQGGTSVVSTYDIPVGALVCNVLPPTVPPGIVANPRMLDIPDPNNVGRVCEWTDPGTGGPFSRLPFSTTLVYEATMRAVNLAGAGPEGPRSNPFSRPGTPPAAPGAVRVRP